jgi:hypothetical protein
LLDGFFDLCLGLDVERVGVERFDRAHPLELCVTSSFLLLLKERGEAFGRLQGLD